MLSVKNVTVKYGNTVALDNISIDFENGVYGLIAPNGAGKTTLIKLLSRCCLRQTGRWSGTAKV